MKIAIIGCGTMGTAMAQRLSSMNQLLLHDHHIEKAEHLAQKGFGVACKTVQEALQSADMIILAIKPQNVKQVAGFKEGQLIVSLLAGTSIHTLGKYFSNAQIVRMMPNLALIHGEGVIGLSTDEKMTQEVKDGLTRTFDVLGKIYWLPEDEMNALTALTGSGPAFVITMVEAMIEAGIAMGFSSKDAKELVYQMLQGSLALLKETSKHPGELRWQIASPQGTTIAGIKRLEELALRGAIINTFLAAYEQGCKISL